MDPAVRPPDREQGRRDRSRVSHALTRFVADVPRAEAAASLAIVLAVTVAGAAVGYRAFSPAVDASGPAALLESTEFWPALRAVLAQNLGAALLAFSGVVTAGLSTLLGISLTSIWVGATFHAVQAELGTTEVLTRAVPYVGLEFAGIVLAATAGLLPAVVLVTGRFRTAPRHTYVSSIAGALRLFLAAVVLIAIGGVIEASVITTAHP